MTKLIEDLLIYIFFLGGRLRQQWQVLLYCDFSSIQKFLHNTHKLDKLLTDDFKAGLSVRTCKHFDIAVKKLSNFLYPIKGKTQIILLHEYVENVVFVDTENAAESGLKRNCSFYFESSSYMTVEVR